MLSARDAVAYRPIRTAHEAKFSAFLEYIGRADLCKTESRDSSAFAIQFVQQVNFGAVESKRYFATSALVGGDEAFKEIDESQMKEMNLKKTDSFKNFKSLSENRFYEVNLYRVVPDYHQKLVNAIRPASDIDL